MLDEGLLQDTGIHEEVLLTDVRVDVESPLDGDGDPRPGLGERGRVDVAKDDRFALVSRRENLAHR